MGQQTEILIPLFGQLTSADRYESSDNDEVFRVF